MAERILSSPASEINGEKYSFTFSKEKKGKGKLVGITKMGADGTFNTPVDLRDRMEYCIKQ